MKPEAFEGVIGRTVAESTPAWASPSRPPEGSPNIVLIVLDDVGFAQLGCYGSTIQTPNIDRLAAAGLRYSGFHVTPLCSPTRACLLTGRNHHAVGMGDLSTWGDLGFPGRRGAVSHSAATLAEMLQLSGYNTFATGKWHLTPADHQTPAGPYDHWPLQRGFERFHGFLDFGTSQWRPDLVYDNHRIGAPDRPDYHLTEDIVDHSIEFIRDQAAVAPDKPFFLYLALGATHDPHHAPAAFIDKYNGAFDQGWDACRLEWFERQKELGVVPQDTVLPARNPGVKEWDRLDARERKLFVRLQEAFAGMLDHADLHIGRLLAYLEHIGRRENTLLVLLSDNGASGEGGSVGYVNSIVCCNSLEDTVQSNMRGYADIGTERSGNNYPFGWAMAGNTPLRWYKINTHEGGVRVPLIVDWPAAPLKGRGGARFQFHYATDVVPTILEAIGLEAPEVYRGVPQLPVHGVSMAYTFFDAEVRTRKREQHWEMSGHRGIWIDGWKAVTRHVPDQSFEDDRWELYNLDHDFSEAGDLASTQPAKLRELIDRWWVAAERYQVLPLDDRRDELWFSRGSPGSLRDRTVWTFFPGMPHLGTDVAPAMRNVSHSITAKVGALEAATEGVLLAHGGHSGGYSLFVLWGRLVYAYNYVGTQYRVEGELDLPRGPSTIRCAFSKTGDLAGRVDLYLDAELIGTGDIPKTLPFLLSEEGMDVGEDRFTPVVDDYEPPFRFSGLLESVVIALDEDADRKGGGESGPPLLRQ